MIVAPSQSLNALKNFTMGEISEVTCVADVAASLDGKYFKFNSDNVAYYVWFEVDASGVTDPAPGGTGIHVALTSGASASTVATAVKNAINSAAVGEASATSSGAVVRIVNATDGNATDVSAGDSGFSVRVSDQGVAGTIAEVTPASAVDSISNQP